MEQSFDYFLSNLSDDERESFLQNARRKTYKKGELVIKKDDTDKKVFFLISGAVRATIYDNKDDLVILREMSPGEIFGEFAILSGKNRTTDIMVSKDSEIMIVEGEDFLNLITANEENAKFSVKYLGKLLREEAEQKIKYVTLDARARILFYFLDASNKSYSTTFTIPKIKELASYLNMSSETLSRQISAFIKEGLIERKNKEITLLNVDGIKAEL